MDKKEIFKKCLPSCDSQSEASALEINPSWKTREFKL